MPVYLKIKVALNLANSVTTTTTDFVMEFNAGDCNWFCLFT